MTIATTPVQRERMGGGESTVDVTLFINACSHFRGRDGGAHSVCSGYDDGYGSTSSFCSVVVCAT